MLPLLKPLCGGDHWNRFAHAVALRNPPSSWVEGANGVEKGFKMQPLSLPMGLEGAGNVTSAGIVGLLRCDVGIFVCLVRLADAVTGSLGALCSHELCVLVELRCLHTFCVLFHLSATLSFKSRVLCVHVTCGGHPLFTTCFLHHDALMAFDREKRNPFVFCRKCCVRVSYPEL